MKDVTQMDASEKKIIEENPEKIEVVPNPRDAVFQAIEDRRALELKNNMVDNGESQEEIDAQMKDVKDVMKSSDDETVHHTDEKEKEEKITKVE